MNPAHPPTVAEPPEHAPHDAPIAPDAPSDALVTVVPGIGLVLGDYQHDDERDPDLLRAQRIEQLQRRAGGTPDPPATSLGPPKDGEKEAQDTHSAWRRR